MISQAFFSPQRLLYTDFGIGGVVAGTTPVSTWGKPYMTFIGTLTRIQLHLDNYWRFAHHQFGDVCGDNIFAFRFESIVLVNSQIQMESNQDSAALALQIQTLTASMEELTRQNQEMRLQL